MGCPPGIETVLVEHSGNITSSAEEAAEVVRQVRRHLGLAWHTEQGTRPLGAADILVVAAYNAQVNLIRDALDRGRTAGRPGGHRGQVPGPGSGRSDRVHGVFSRGRSAAGHGIPALAQPDQRGGLPRAVAGRDGPRARTDQLPAHASGGPGAAGRVHRPVPEVHAPAPRPLPAGHAHSCQAQHGTCPFFANPARHAILGRRDMPILSPTWANGVLPTRGREGHVQRWLSSRA